MGHEPDERVGMLEGGQSQEARATVHVLTQRVHDLSEQAARIGLEQQRRRVDRWRARLFMICQMAVAAGTAWWLGQRLLGHPMPFFASVAAILCLGLSFGQRITRVVEVSCGVFIGVMVGDLLVHFIGTGPWQIMLVVFVAMSVATWLNARTLMINQAGIQAATVMTLMPAADQGFSRWTDALLGCALALLFALVAPASPVQKPRRKAGAVLESVARTLISLHQAMSGLDEGAAERLLSDARGTNALMAELDEAAREGVAVVRYSPFLRGHRDTAQAMAELVGPLDRLVRNLRVVARRGVIAAYRQEEVPDDYLALLDLVAEVVLACAAELGERRLPVAVRPQILAVAERSAQVGVHGSLSGMVVLAQLRSMLVDLLELTGLDYVTAREQVPEVD